MSTNPIGAAHVDPWARLGEAIDAHANALGAVQDATRPPADSVDLSRDALDALRAAPTAENAVVDAISAGAQVEASAAVARADEARFQALVFVLAHHGPPL